MKKLLSALAVASFAFVPLANADIVGFEVGTYQWKPDYAGTIKSDSNSILGTDIDINDDLGFDDESHNIFWVTAEHPVPFLPNIKIVSSDLKSSAESVLTREITFNGQTYSINENVSTAVDMSNTEYTLYYEILDNWVNLDLGVTLRQYDGMISLQTPPTGTDLNEEEDIDFTIPLIYGKARFDLPFSGFFAEGELNIISYDDDSISDIMVGVGYESDIGFGAKIGYRTFELDVEEDDITADMEFKGAYFSAFYHF
ncbi:TIGR04219 family outer membrane beta-barrel protein [Aliikangiella sp. IMCC44359]|uniref:TIGR04219 family outer membrane beta-barrel protein n=1 Tax=Aliikangiella sp. IMCC44359 TaxID=3459125 RepID=UPI00403A85A3